MASTSGSSGSPGPESAEVVTSSANMSTSSLPTSLPSPTIAVGFHHGEERASIAASVSNSEPNIHAPGFQSPLRHHRRTPSVHRQVKETLNARTEYTNNEEDGRLHHRINQYIIKDEIGRGSYGAVHLATDQFGNEYAVKEFSKARLRKRAQSNILRHGPRRGGPGRFPGPLGPGGPLSPHFSHFGHDSGGSRPGSSAGGAAHDSLFLIREEIAIMKKLNHPNLVQLIEVLDDPEEDSLYMVLEMCKKGVVMKVGLGDQATPYPEESCRYWFRDLILGIEYLHAQGVIHRDIKPDNLLLSDKDELKIVDFGVSEIFEKTDEMMTAKSAGSPAFLPPELCVARHGDVSGKAADIWSMGVSLYCLRYGRIPFQRDTVLEVYDAIKTEEVALPADENPEFVDLMTRILEKDPKKRIKMPDLREHPWVTKDGADRMLSAEINCGNLVEPPNELEVNRAFTRKMNHLLCVMKAIQKFKAALARRAAERGVARKSNPFSGSDKPFNAAEAKAKAEEVEALVEQRRNFIKGRGSTDPWRKASQDGGGQDATDHAEEDAPFLGIGAGSSDPFKATDKATPADVVSDSPTAVDFNVYDRAYEEEIQRIMARPAKGTTMYLTRFVKEREQYRGNENVAEGAASASATPPVATPMATPMTDGEEGDQVPAPLLSGGFAHIVKKAMAR